MQERVLSTDPAPQKAWTWLRALNFSFTGLGAGLFLVSLWLDLPWGALLGWSLVIISNASLLADVGRAERAWRMVLNYRLSWMARGVAATGIFITFGFLYWASLQGWLPLVIGSPGFWAIKTVAGSAALFLLLLDGLIMNSTPAISLWRTNLLPVLFSLYGLLGGATFTLLLLHYGLGEATFSLTALAWAVVGLLAATLAFTFAYMGSTLRGFTAEGFSNPLLRGQYAPYWLGLVIGVGLIIPLSLTAYTIGTQEFIPLIWTAITILIGNYAIRLLLLQAGVYSLNQALHSRARRYL